MFSTKLLHKHTEDSSHVRVWCVCACMGVCVWAQNKHMSCLSVYCACFIVLIKLLFPDGAASWERAGSWMKQESKAGELRTARVPDNFYGWCSKGLHNSWQISCMIQKRWLKYNFTPGNSSATHNWILFRSEYPIIVIEWVCNSIPGSFFQFPNNPYI